MSERTRGAGTASSETRLELRVRLPLAHFTLEVDVVSSARSLGIFGASGAGKTTLIETIAGWRAPIAGRIRVGERLFFDGDAGRALAIEQRAVGYVPQDALLWPHWNVRQNLRAAAARLGAHAVDEDLLARTSAILEIAHLMERSPAHLSGGERQRVALARALVSRPKLLLLDEPLGSLDLALRRRILPYLIRVRDEFQLPTVFVSHDATEVQALCDEVVVLEAGRVRAQGAPAEVLRYARAGERAFENVLGGSVAALQGGTASIELDAGGRAQVPALGLQVGARTLFALGSDEILIALDAPTRISARNVVPALVERLHADPSGVTRVDACLEGGSGARLSATLTRASVEELQLHAGRAIFLVFKTNSCRVLSTTLEQL
jgi:molybdate transport system ATP-binding protein